MCGISGFIHPTKTSDDLLRMQQCLIHRGPDSQSHYFLPGVGLAHNRLSIIDLSSAAGQPFYFEKLVLIYNGEIYNYVEIREELVKKGYLFHTQSDSEVLIKGFHCWGISVVHKIIGMFAFAIFNQETKELYLCRDRVGVKPLFYQVDSAGIVFASELKALTQGQHTEICNEGLFEYLRFGYTFEDLTFYKGLKKIPPGSYLKYHTGKVTISKYWNPEEFIHNKFHLTENALADQLEELLVSSFNYRMVSDVPVGIFFSGGIDSTALVALLSKNFSPLNTFTIGFEDQQFDETPFAKKIAAYFNTNHVEKILTLKAAKKRLDEFYSIYDEPFYDSSGIPTSLVAELTKEHGIKVVLSSEGGDELFAGYPAYQSYYALGRKMMPWPQALRKGLTKFIPALPFVGVRNKIEKLKQLVSSSDWIDFYMHSISSITDKTLKRNFLDKFETVEKKYVSDETLNAGLHPMELFMLWDLKYVLPNDYLVKIDRATMHHGVESREPFLDHRLIEFCLQLPLQMKLRNGETKYLLRKVLSRHIPSSYFDRPKMGFNIPLFSWFKQEFDQAFLQRLTSNNFHRAWPQLNPQLVKNELQVYRHGSTLNKEINIVTMWKLLNLELWRDYNNAHKHQ
jgi:asparagine synthase (glutamine-hydrolysing)